MAEHLPIFLRAHTEVVRLAGSSRETPKKTRPNPLEHKKINICKWPEYALVFDCETTTDTRQALTFGSFRFCCVDIASNYRCIEEGIFCDELSEADPEALAVLRGYARTAEAETLEGFTRKMRLLSRSDFMELVFWKAADRAEALVVGFNLPFDLSRLALDNRIARRRNEGWSLVMFQDLDPESGKPREHPFRPRIIITPKDSKAAFIRFAGISKRSKKTKQRLIPYRRGRFLDLRTFGWALRNESYSLQRACEAFGVPGKLDHKPTGCVSREEVEYCRQDIRATVSLLNAMRREFDRHPIDLAPEQAYSPASIAKAYLGAI